MTKPTIRMIGLDLDNTVLTTEKQVTPAVEDAIRRAGEAGIIVLPATGRQLSGVPQVIFGLPGVRYALTSNGARVYELPSRRVLYEDCFAPETACSILAACRAYSEIFISVFINGGCYAEQGGYTLMKKLVDPATYRYILATRTAVPSLDPVLAQNPKHVEKFSLVYPDGECRDAAWEDFAARGDCTVTSSMHNNLELNNTTSNKGAGLLALGRLLGIPREQIMAIGDESNDIEMLKAVGYGVAMGNATEDVKQVAKAVTLSCDEDGVAAAINAILC